MRKSTIFFGCTPQGQSVADRPSFGALAFLSSSEQGHKYVLSQFAKDRENGFVNAAGVPGYWEILFAGAKFPRQRTSRIELWYFRDPESAPRNILWVFEYFEMRQRRNFMERKNTEGGREVIYRVERVAVRLLADSHYKIRCCPGVRLLTWVLLVSLWACIAAQLFSRTKNMNGLLVHFELTVPPFRMVDGGLGSEDWLSADIRGSHIHFVKTPVEHTGKCLLL
jgi:hypothetical protein